MRSLGTCRLLLFLALCGMGVPPASAGEWFRVVSSSGQASVLFPNPAEEVQEMVDRTPGGKVTTRVAKHQGEGILMSISETKLPRLAMEFAGPRLIFDNARGQVLQKAFGREVSSEPLEVEGADAASVMRYASVDFEDEDHPG